MAVAKCDPVAVFGPFPCPVLYNNRGINTL
jgi:hypothetical protein